MHDAVTSQQLLTLFGGVVGSGAAISLVTEFFKRIGPKKSKALVHTLVIILTAAAGVAQYALTLKHIPAEILGVSGVAIWGVSQAFYKAVPSVVAFLNTGEKDAEGNAQQADQEVAAIAAPADITSADIAPAAPVDAAPAAPAEPASAPVNEFNA